MIRFDSVRNCCKKAERYLRNLDSLLFRKTGYGFHDVSFDNIVNFLYKPTDPASLGVTRMLFGFMMVIDGPNERGGAEVDFRWGDPRTCHFPLLPWTPPTLPYITMIYFIMWIGSVGIAFGYKFRRSALMFTLAYWYILLLDKSFWNNHSYLFGLIAILLTGSQANNYLSLDSFFDKSQNEKNVPYWNYFILKYQFFILYFVAGLKKSDKEWLSGYAMTNLSNHWVFDPFKFFLNTEQTDYLIVHWFGFIFDLTVCFWMMYEYTRPVAMVFCASFHLMNSRLFSIGMFPWVCLATMPLFYPPDWPKKTIVFMKDFCTKLKLLPIKEKQLVTAVSEDQVTCEDNINNDEYFMKNVKKSHQDCLKNVTSPRDDRRDISSLDDNLFETPIDKSQTIDCGKQHEKLNAAGDANERDGDNKLESGEKSIKTNKGKKIVVSLLMVHITLQVFLPYSHFITKGYNNWTNGLYGYSWDMMVYNWDTSLVLVKIVDNESKSEIYVDPEAWTQNDRWTKHGDMLYQYAHCLHRNLISDLERMIKTEKPKDTIIHGKKYDLVYDKIEKEKLFDDLEESSEESKKSISNNISIYIDIWCSLNGRFQQRMFNPNLDLVKMSWSPLKPMEWLMPLLTEFTIWREAMNDIQDHVYTWNNYSDVLFVADFPGMHLENFISPDFSNVTLTVLEGQVFYEKMRRKTHMPEKSNAVHLTKGESYKISAGVFHKVHTVGTAPACYMYTYMNATRMNMNEDRNRIRDHVEEIKDKPKLPLVTEWVNSIKNIVMFLQHVCNALLNIVYGVPMMRRVQAQSK